MKFIGQYIQSFIARFRSDVYLEDIDTGTIASGGNLGLDSNNKIVKAAASSGGISHDGSTANGVLTFKDADEATVEANLTFNGSSLNINGAAEIASDGKLFFRDQYSFIQSPSANDLLIATAADFEIEAAGIAIDSSGKINLEIGDGDFINMYNTTNKFAFFYAESGASSSFQMNEMGGDSSDDRFNIAVFEHGATLLTTRDAAAAAAHFEIDADGDITLDAAGQIKLEPGTSVLWDSLALTGIQASGETFSDDDVSLMTSAAIDDKINTKYAYTYMTFSASAVPTNSGSDPEWMFPNPNKGIYEEDWNSDSGITSTVLENSTAVGKNHAANSIPLPHTGVLVGFHAIGRNDDSNLSFKAGLFHSSGAGTGDGIDWGNTGVNNEFTLECVATADTSGGVSGSSSFKGPCKLVSNTVNKTIAAGDTILPAIMATADNATDEIYVTWTIILKIPLTT